MNPYKSFLNLRDYLYSKKIIKSYHLDKPVISVGNINTGGSGKTPFIYFLVKFILGRYPEKKILIVSKNYKAQSQEPLKVDLKKNNAAIFYGDEPCLLQTLMPEVDVWSGPKKFQTALKAIKTSHYDLVLVDDGFSHLKLSRNINLVLFDVSRSLDHYRLMPLGHLREPYSSLSRADMVILTKMENQPLEKIDFFKQQIKLYNSSVYESKFKMILPLGLKKQIFLVTSIANPEPILQFLKQENYSVIKHLKFSDHYALNEQTQQSILNDLKKIDQDVDILMTEKDRIKITNEELLSRSKLIQLQVDMPEEQKVELHEKISQIF